jgi:hypothetical protein
MTDRLLVHRQYTRAVYIVPLGHAHKTVGAGWTREKKRAFANDTMNLLVVDDSTNQAKGDNGPDEWKPPRREYWKTEDVRAEVALHKSEVWAVDQSDRGDGFK